jgi:hypothetical protein
MMVQGERTPDLLPYFQVPGWQGQIAPAPRTIKDQDPGTGHPGPGEGPGHGGLKGAQKVPTVDGHHTIAPGHGGTMGDQGCQVAVRTG